MNKWINAKGFYGLIIGGILLAACGGGGGNSGPNAGSDTQVQEYAPTFDATATPMDEDGFLSVVGSSALVGQNWTVT